MYSSSPYLYEPPLAPAQAPVVKAADPLEANV